MQREKNINIIQPSPVNEWNHYHDYLARPLSDYREPDEDLTTGMTAHPIHPATKWDEQEEVQDGANPLLAEKLAGSGW